MTARILSGKEYAAKIKEAAKKEAESLGIRPGLAVVMVGDNPASAVYVRNKNKACEELGFHSVMETLPADTSKDELLAVIDRLNGDASIHGILVQLPLPAALSDAEQEVLNRISPDKDVFPRGRARWRLVRRRAASRCWNTRISRWTESGRSSSGAAISWGNRWRSFFWRRTPR